MGKLSGLLSVFSPTDEQAMGRLQRQDDQAAFVQLVRHWEKPVFRLCARMTGDAHLAEDLKQEVFTRVFTRRKDFRGGFKFSTWLWRIALNLCYDELRKRGRHGECPLPEDWGEATPLLEPATEEPAPDACLAAAEECDLVRQALLQLPDTQRAALALRYCEGLKLRELAEVLEVPATTAASRVAAGLARLTQILEPTLGPTRGKPGAVASPSPSDL